jgi:hypothetical protein
VRRVLRGAAAAFALGALAFGQVGVSHARDTYGAEGEGSDDTSDLVSRGIALRRAGEDARALELFQQAERLQPTSTRVQVHLAATHQALGNWEAADSYLSRALQNPEDPYVQRHQATLAAARRMVDSHIGSLELAGGPKGTEVRLNGRLVGTLPLTQNVRVEAGIYTLEARLRGHYTVTRSVALAGGSLVRETVELAPQSGSPPPPGGEAPPGEDVSASSSGPTWLPWVFGGVAVAAGVGTVAAWAARERHAEKWNDDAVCLRGTQTREQRCADEREAGETAERWMVIGAAATGAATTAAIISAVLQGNSAGSERDSASSHSPLRCGVGFAELSCFGRF